MSAEQILTSRVRAVRSRFRLLVVQRWLCDALLVSAGVVAVLVLLTRMRWWPDAVDFTWLPVAAAGLLGVLVGLSRRIPAASAAQLVDEAAGLKERLSTAVAVLERAERSPIAQAQVEDAARVAELLQARRVVPWRPPPRGRQLAAAFAVVAALHYLPDLPIFQSAQARADRAAMAVEGERIRKIGKELQKKAEDRPKGDENAEILRKVAQEMQRLGNGQARNRIDKKTALLKLNELQKQVKEAEHKARGQEAPKSLEAASKELRRLASTPAGEAPNPNAAALRKMAENLDKKDLDAAARQLEELSERLKGGQLGKEDMKQLSELMDQMAESMKGTNLDKASQELKSASKELQEALQRNTELRERLKNAASDAEREQVQRELDQSLSQGLQSAATQAAQAGGT